ncbi:MAG: DUF4097 family beta strand repeat-containing protein [Bryobacteraceae bacterium]|jgi:hypothetical protein
MKTIFALAGAAIAVCSLAAAQDGAGRVVVPARPGGHARQLRVHVINNSITVKTYGGSDVIVESGSHATPSAGGMRRIDGPRGLTIDEADNVIEIHADPTLRGPLTITVPADMSVDLHTLNGNLSVDGLRGEVDADTLSGRTELAGISGTVVAHSLNGPIHVVMDRVDPSKPLSFSSLNGSIDVALPADVKANVKFKTMSAEIYSDFEIALGGLASAGNGNSGGLRFRLRFDNNFEGVINGGGVAVSFHTLHGTIYLRKKK